MYNLLKYLWGAGVIPNAFRIHHCDGSSCADLETIHLGAIDECVRPSEIKLLQASL